MATTNELVNAVLKWTVENPNATNQQLATAVQAAGGLTPELAKVLAVKYGTTTDVINSVYTTSTAPAPAPAPSGGLFTPTTTSPVAVPTYAPLGDKPTFDEVVGAINSGRAVVKPLPLSPEQFAEENRQHLDYGVYVDGKLVPTSNDFGVIPQNFKVSYDPITGEGIYDHTQPQEIRLRERIGGSQFKDVNMAYDTKTGAVVPPKENQFYTSGSKDSGFNVAGLISDIGKLANNVKPLILTAAGSYLAGSGLLGGATSTVNPYSIAADYGAPTASGGLGLTGNTTANLASMGGAQGLTTAGTGLTAATLGELGGIAPYAGLGAGIGTTGLASGTGSLLGSGAASSLPPTPTTTTVTPAPAPTTTPPTTVPTAAPTAVVPPVVPPVIPTFADKVLTGVGAGVATNVATSLLNPNTIQGGLQTAGGLLQTQASKDAALQAQKDLALATSQATTGAQFRPVGVTTKFGTSQFTTDPITGQLKTAGYTGSPEIVSAQDQLMKLGAGYLAQTPEQVASDYLKKQYELLDPSRQRQLADIRNQNLQTGRGGLSVGSTGLRPSGAQGLMGSNPEMQAYYNALAQQDAALVAQAQQAGQQQVTYGAGLFGQAGTLENMAQQPFTLGTGLGTSISTAGANAGRLNLAGQDIATGYATSSNATRNPYATLLGAVGGPTSTLGAGINKYLTDYLATNKSAGLFDSAKYGEGMVGFQKALDDMYGAPTSLYGSGNAGFGS